jgi:hypothetical protein
MLTEIFPDVQIQIISPKEFKIGVDSINIIIVKDSTEWRIMFEYVENSDTEVFLSETFDLTITKQELADFIQLVIKLAEKKLLRVGKPIDGLEWLLEKINI